MPIGCLPLCRYDTSREEIKMAFEKGQCGILNISPVCFWIYFYFTKFKKKLFVEV